MTMTRLIDADALRAWFSDHSVYDEFPIGYIMGLLDDQPTVDAIPIEWIESQVDKGKWAELVQRWAEREKE